MGFLSDVLKEKKRKRTSFRDAFKKVADAEPLDDDEQREAERRKRLRKRIYEQHGVVKQVDEVAEDVTMSEEQFIKAFRKLKAPIKLFAETYDHRIRRLRNLQRSSLDRMRSQQNIFKEHFESEDKKLMERMLRKTMGGGHKETNTQEKSFKQKVSNYVNVPLPLLGSQENPHDYVAHMIQRLLHEWEVYLQNRDASIAHTLSGKREYATWVESNEFLKPLMGKLKAHEVPTDILKFTTTMFQLFVAGKQRESESIYFQMSIGNATWPLGVGAQVGIHSRSSRDRLSQSSIAHVLNSEEQRKYIQTIKRLLTFGTKMYPAAKQREQHQNTAITPFPS
mmetsp:Transcript_8682/g.12828  ORF Transcript_8682/g.12828 Transcript_8682/m.12828 type:complete len:337 (-) Transcript_8682:1157-2167(-)